MKRTEQSQALIPRNIPLDVQWKDSQIDYGNDLT